LKYPENMALKATACPRKRQNRGGGSFYLPPADKRL
jgi:hypothetical protein